MNRVVAEKNCIHGNNERQSDTCSATGETPAQRPFASKVFPLARCGWARESARRRAMGWNGGGGRRSPIDAPEIHGLVLHTQQRLLQRDGPRRYSSGG